MTIKAKIHKYITDYEDKDLFVKLLIFFILVSPIVDILTSVGKRELNIDLSIGIVLKGLFLLYIGMRIIFEKSESKLQRILKGMVIVLVLYALIHVAVVYYSFGLQRMILAALNLAKTFFFPVFTIGLVRYLKKEDYKDIRDAMVMSGTIIILTMAISMVTGTDYNAYKFNKLGSVGWFFAANEVSAFIGILTPIMLYYLLEKWKLSVYIKILLIIGYIVVYYQIGTKVVGLSVILVTAFLIFYHMAGKLKYPKRKLHHQMVPLLLILVFAIGFVPMTPIGINMNIHLELLNYEKPEVGVDEGDSEGELSEDFDMEELLKNNPQILNFIFSGRDQYFVARKHMYEESRSLQKVFGLSQFGRTDDGEIKSYIVEIDYVDIFFNFGIVGAVLYWAMIGTVILSSLNQLLKNRLLFVLDSPLPYILSAILLAFGIGMFAGHVFVSPAVSMYIALYLAMLHGETQSLKENASLQ